MLGFSQRQPRPSRTPSPLQLADGSRVGVIGAGPAGSFFSYFLLEMSQRAGIDVAVDLYEARDFAQIGPQGCNMCGGIISESLVQNLAAEGIVLAHDVIQRGIDSYVLHMDVGSVKIETPKHEMRIGAVHRGSGPKDIKDRQWESFDGHLEAMAVARGVGLVRARVDEVALVDGRPTVRARDREPVAYDLLAVCVGVNSPTLKLFEGLGIGYTRPAVTKTLIREYYLGRDAIGATLGSAMHVFLLRIPRLEFAAIIPKGDYVTMCLLGEDIDNTLIEAFVAAPEVRRCMPPDWDPARRSCQCLPHINVRPARSSFADRFVFIGDCGVTRLYKDGIGAAYRTARAAARTAVFSGVSAADFARQYQPVCRRIAADNRVGRLAFASVGIVQRARFLRQAMLQVTANEQTMPGEDRRMSGVLWDMFSGSAPYADIFSRMFRPALIARLTTQVAAALVRGAAHTTTGGAQS